MEKVLNRDQIFPHGIFMQSKLSKAKIVGFRPFSSDVERFIIIRQEDLGYRSCFNIIHSLQVGQNALQINEVDIGCVVTLVGKHRIY